MKNKQLANFDKHTTNYNIFMAVENPTLRDAQVEFRNLQQHSGLGLPTEEMYAKLERVFDIDEMYR